MVTAMVMVTIFKMPVLGENEHQESCRWLIGYLELTDIDAFVL